MLKNLSIPQEFVLLALDRETNKIKSSFRTNVALYTVMACFFDLSISGNVSFEDNDTVKVSNTASTGEKYLDRLLEIIAAEKPKKLKEWVSYFYYKQKEIYKMVVESLVDKGVLEIENTEVLFVVPVKKYSDVANARSRIVEKIRAELLEQGKVEEHTVALVLFLNIKNMLNDYFSDYEQKTLKQRLEILRKEDINKKIKTVHTAIQNIEAGM
ncbi:GPP34 family phosphoprotein [Paenibacillus pasadenensis]|uniref:GOLPH3/VPS74 family protein n=1 Tax=Paenibacillus pasadenensis TaxID=217090 RepID=UPI00203AECD0|nr:GPP34 family phosphoprotein [Paenibacillus pasadenensis]MCM3748910.1 GPP34 family phosphoprotein [Paenibacillus pasadenensis]